MVLVPGCCPISYRMFIHLRANPSTLDSYILAAEIIFSAACSSAVARVILAIRSRSA